MVVKCGHLATLLNFIAERPELRPLRPPKWMAVISIVRYGRSLPRARRVSAWCVEGCAVIVPLPKIALTISCCLALGAAAPASAVLPPPPSAAPARPTIAIGDGAISGARLTPYVNVWMMSARRPDGQVTNLGLWTDMFRRRDVDGRAVFERVQGMTFGNGRSWTSVNRFDPANHGADLVGRAPGRWPRDKANLRRQPCHHSLHARARRSRRGPPRGYAGRRLRLRGRHVWDAAGRPAIASGLCRRDPGHRRIQRHL